MTLQDHLDVLGIDSSMLAHLAGHGHSQVITKGLVDRAIRGDPIAHSKALTLCEALSRQYGLHGSGPGRTKLKTLAPEDIEGLVTFTPGNVHPVEH
jgi:hypothetical protein